MVSNITFTDNSGNVVTIGVVRCEEIWLNEFKFVKVPKNVANESEGITTMIINLLRSLRSFNIDGWIQAKGDDATGAFGGTDTAEQQRTKLRNMANSLRNVEMDYGSEISDLSGGIQKLSIMEETQDNPSTEKVYRIKILFITGQNILTGEGA